MWAAMKNATFNYEKPYEWHLWYFYVVYDHNNLCHVVPTISEHGQQTYGPSESSLPFDNDQCQLLPPTSLFTTSSSRPKLSRLFLSCWSFIMNLADYELPTLIHWKMDKRSTIWRLLWIFTTWIFFKSTQCWLKFQWLSLGFGQETEVPAIYYMQRAWMQRTPPYFVCNPSDWLCNAFIFSTVWILLDSI